MVSVRCFVFLAALLCAQATESKATARVNPIRRVVTMLESIHKKLEEEGQQEETLFNKFMCFCKSGKGSLEASVAEAETKIPQLEDSIKGTSAELEGLASSLDAAKAGREDAEKSLAEGKALRAKENAAFAKESADAQTNIAALKKAISALSNGVAGGFLQTSVAALLRKVSITVDINPSDRDVLSSFLATGSSESSNYVPQSGEIIGILKQIHDTMEASLADAIAAEEESKNSFESMRASKEKQVGALTEEIEVKSQRNGGAAVELVNTKKDLQDTSDTLAEDKAFLADLAKGCATKEAEWAERQKTRSEEILAIFETIKILNDDDALELFKKTLPNPSLLQVEVSAKAVRQQALTALMGTQKKYDGKLDFIALALKGRTVGFEKVLTMIDEMTALLASEQTGDDEKKAYCAAELDATEDQLKGLGQKISDLDKASEEHTGTVAALKGEIAALQDVVKALDADVADATEQRKSQHAEYVESLAANKAAADLLGVAKNRLQAFYNPALHKAAPKRELSEEDRVAVNFGGTAAPTPAPGGIAGTGIVGLQVDSAPMLVQITAHDVSRVDPGAAPETWSAYEKKGEENNGVLAMIDLLVGDITKEIQEMGVEEKNSQAEYESLMADSSAKRASDVKSIADKGSAKADLEGALQELAEETKATKAESMLKMETLSGLHSECDWLTSNYETRKQARAGEIESLKAAKAVLSGADYSLLQMSAQLHQAPEENLAKEMTQDLQANFNKIAPFGKEDTAKELQDHASKTQDTLVDAVENAEVAEIKRAVFRALTRLRAATIKEFDTIARLETQAIDAYNDAHHYRAENPLAHLHEDEAPVETDKLKSFH